MLRLSISTIVTMGAILTVVSPAFGAVTCDDTLYTDANCCTSGTGNPLVCLKVSGGPDINTDFAINDSDAAKLDVSLISGDSWTIWSQVSDSDDSPAAIGDITINGTAASTADFELTIHNDPASDDGATTVESINLVHPSTWTGHSSLEGGAINSDMNGDIDVQAGGGTGGEINFRIEGDAKGDITAETIPSGGFLTLRGGVEGLVWIKGEAAGLLSTNTVAVDSAAEIRFDGPVTGGFTIGSGGINGDLNVNDQLEGSGGVIVGLIGTTSDITIADMVSDSGGTASSLQFGQGNIEGDVTLTTGVRNKQTVDFLGETKDISGTITLNDDLAGTVSFSKELVSGGLLDINGSVTGTLTFDSNAVGGAIDILNDVSGTITIEESFSGDMDVDGDVSGDLDFEDDFSGTLDIAASLDQGGGIIVSRVMTGDVTIGEGTNLTSDIVFSDGMDTGSSLVINDTQGDHAAEGDILLGVTKAPFPVIETDGCILIRVYDTDPPQSESYGDLDGDINIVGCHSGNVDLNICAHVNLGSISFDSGGCTPSYSTAYSCQGSCP